MPDIASSIILSTQEMEVGGFEASPGKSSRPYLKNKLKSKKTEGVAQVV
jgi:hypothetical protein